MKNLRVSRILSFSLLLAASVLVGCGEDTAPTSTPAAVPSATSTLPVGWTHKENYPVAPGVLADYADFAQPSKGFAANVVVLSSPASGFPASDGMQMEIDNARSTPSISGFVVDSSSAVLVGGVSGYRGQFRYTQVVNGISFQLLCREYMAVVGGKDVQIVLTRLQDDSLAAAAFRVIEPSIRFTGAAK